MCGQVVALGLCFGEKAYLKSSWNVLDGVLVLISVIDILVSMVSDSGTKILGMLRVLRLLRTLRPLRWVEAGQDLGDVCAQGRGQMRQAPSVCQRCHRTQWQSPAPAAAPRPCLVLGPAPSARENWSMPLLLIKTHIPCYLCSHLLCVKCSLTASSHPFLQAVNGFCNKEGN